MNEACPLSTYEIDDFLTDCRTNLKYDKEKMFTEFQSAQHDEHRTIYIGFLHTCALHLGIDADSSTSVC